jgi:hypothetical protein
VVREEIGGTALLVEIAETVEIAGERALMAGVGDAGADHFKGSIEEYDGREVGREQLAIGRFVKSSSAEGKDRGTLEAREDESEVMVLDGAETAFTQGGKQFGNRAVSVRNFDIEIDERAGKLEREETSDSSLASPHESDEDQQRRRRIVGH